MEQAGGYEQAQRGPAQAEPRASSLAGTTMLTINLSDDEETEGVVHNPQVISNATPETYHKLAGPSKNKMSTNDNYSAIEDYVNDNVDVKVKPEIIEIDDDAPSPRDNVVEAIREIDLKNVDATAIYESDEEDVKTVLDIELGNVHKDGEIATELSRDSECSNIKCEITDNVKFENDFNDTDATAYNDEDFKNIIDAIDIEEHDLVREGSNEPEEKVVKCSFRDLNSEIQDLKKSLSKKNNRKLNLRNKLEKVSWLVDQLQIELLANNESPCEVQGGINEKNDINTGVNSANILHKNTTGKEDSEVQNLIKIEGSSEFDATDVKPTLADNDNFSINEVSSQEQNTNKKPDYFTDTNVIEYDTDTQNNIDPKLLMCPIVILERIEEMLLKPKKSPQTHSQLLNNSRSSYSRLFYEKNKALIRRCRPCVVSVRREGGVGGRKSVRLPSRDTLQRNNRRILTAEVAPMLPVQDTNNKRLRPNPPEDYFQPTAWTSPDLGAEPTPSQNLFHPQLPPPRNSMLPEASLSNTYRQSSISHPSRMINPSQQPNYLSNPSSQFSQHSPNETYRHNSLRFQRHRTHPNTDVPQQPFMQNPSQTVNQDWPPVLQQNTTPHWLITQKTSNVIPHVGVGQRLEITPNILTIQTTTTANPTRMGYRTQEDAAPRSILYNVSPQYITHDLETTNMCTPRQSQTQNPSAATRNIPRPNLALAMPVLTNILRPNLTAADSHYGSILTRYLQQNVSSRFDAQSQIIAPQSNQTFLDTAVPPVQTSKALPCIFLPCPTLQPIPSLEIADSPSPTPVEDPVSEVERSSGREKQLPTVVIDLEDDIDEISDDSNQAVPVENSPQSVPKDSSSYILDIGGNYLDWSADVILSNVFVRQWPDEVQHVMCTRRGQGWRLRGHLLLSEHQRPPPGAATWSLRPRVRLKLPPEGAPGAVAASTMYCDRWYKKLSDNPLVYAGVLVAVESAAACLGLLARDAALQLYCLSTCTLQPVTAQRLDDGSYMLSGAPAAAGALADLTRSLHQPGRGRGAAGPARGGGGEGRDRATPLLRAMIDAPRLPLSTTSLLSAMLSAPGPFTPTSVPGQLTLTSAPGPFTPTSAPGPFSSASVPGQLTPTSAPEPFTPTSAPGPFSSAFAPKPFTPTSASGPFSSASVPGQLTPTSAPEPFTPTLASGSFTPTSVPGQLTPTSAPEPFKPTSAPGPFSSAFAPKPLTPTSASGSFTPTSVPGQLTPTSAPEPFTPTSAPGPFSSAFAPKPFTPTSAQGPFTPTLAPGPFTPTSAPGPSAPGTTEQTPAPKSKDPKLATGPARITATADPVLCAPIPPSPRCCANWELLAEADFVAHYRLPRHRVRALAAELEPHMQHFHINKVLACLLYLGSRDAGSARGAGAVLVALAHAALRRRHVPPRPAAPARFQQLFQLPHVLGALAGVSVQLQPEPPPADCRQPAGSCSLDVQLVCDADLNIVSVDVDVARPGWLGRLQRAAGAGWLLGDSSYPQLVTLMTPFPAPASPAEAHYNTLHAHAWGSIKRCVAVLRARWPRLTTRLPEKHARKIVHACAVLHNIAQECRAEVPVVDLEGQSEAEGLWSAAAGAGAARERDRLLCESRKGEVARDLLVQQLSLGLRPDTRDAQPS